MHDYEIESYIKEMELTEYLILEYAKTHVCSVETATDILKATAARQTAHKVSSVCGYLSQIMRAIEDIR